MRSPGPSCGSSRLPVRAGSVAMSRRAVSTSASHRRPPAGPKCWALQSRRSAMSLLAGSVSRIRSITRRRDAGASPRAQPDTNRDHRARHPRTRRAAAPPRRLRKASLRRSSLSASSALALLEEAQPLADDLACVLVPPRRDAAFDEVVEVIRQVDFAGRHARLWNSAQERETGKNRQRKAWFNYIGHGKRSCPSIAWKLRVSAAGALSRTGRRPAAFGGLDP